jgi:hypothetical protein
MDPGMTVTVNCPTRLVVVRKDSKTVTLKCDPAPGATPTAQPTRTRTQPPPTATAQPTQTIAPPTPTHDHGVTPSPVPSSQPPVSGQPCPDAYHNAHAWHPAVDSATGCLFGHEHGDAPPGWVQSSQWPLSFHGHFNTSPIENTTKHAAMKAFAARFNGQDIYFRIHAASNPGDRSAQYHSFEFWVRDAAGNVSHMQGWYDSGDPATARFVRRQGSEPSQRPIILAVDETSVQQGIGCEQWYSRPGGPGNGLGFQTGWMPDFGWTICGSTTYYRANENNDPFNTSTWAMTGSLGGTRRLEIAWYANRTTLRGEFYTTQFGQVVSGPNDAICSSTLTAFGKTYPAVCLQQYIAPTLQSIQFPGNAEQKEFDTRASRKFHPRLAGHLRHDRWAFAIVAGDVRSPCTSDAMSGYF